MRSTEYPKRKIALMSVLIGAGIAPQLYEETLDNVQAIGGSADEHSCVPPNARNEKRTLEASFFHLAGRPQAFTARVSGRDWRTSRKPAITQANTARLAV